MADGLAGAAAGTAAFGGNAQVNVVAVPFVTTWGIITLPRSIRGRYAGVPGLSLGRVATFSWFPLEPLSREPLQARLVQPKVSIDLIKIMPDIMPDIMPEIMPAICDSI